MVTAIDTVTEQFEVGAKVAVADLAWLIVRVHVAVPVQSPVQPENTEPAAGVAVSVMLVP